MLKSYISILGLCILLQSCGSLEPYRTELVAREPVSYSNEDENHNALEVLIDKKNNQFLLYHLEFKNDGSFQLASTENPHPQLSFLKNDLTKRLQSSGKDVLIVSYLHGWSGDAHHLYGHLHKFKNLLRGLNEDESKRGSNSRLVVGVLMSWKGYNAPMIQTATRRDKTLFGRVSHPFSFWSVKKRGHRVGGRGVVKSMAVLNSIKKAQGSKRGIIARRKKVIAATRDHKDRARKVEELEIFTNNPVYSRYIHFGHSFGSAGTISAISPSKRKSSYIKHDYATTMFQDAKRQADFVIMTNPAFEGDRLRSHYEKMFKSNTKSAPRVLVASAQNDAAVKFAFPIGQSLGIINPQNHSGKRSIPSHVLGAGFYKKYHTHELHYANGAPYLKTINNQVKISKFKDKKFQEFFHIGDTAYVSPMIVLQAKSTQLIDGHGGIWEDEFTSFLSDFIKRADERIQLENTTIRAKYNW